MATVTITLTTTPTELLEETRLAVRRAVKAAKHKIDNPTPALEAVIRAAQSFLDGVVKGMGEDDGKQGGGAAPP